jgi:hypothetical protein
MREIVVLQPSIEQALSLARFLHRVDPESRLVGGWTNDDDPPLPHRHPYQEVRRFKGPDLPQGNDDLVIFPTGSSSTELYAGAVGDFRVGEVVFKKENLRASDKLWSLREAAHLGIPIPRTGSSPEELGGFPVFFKSRMEGLHVRGILFDPEGARTLDDPSLYLFQECIPTPNAYGVYFLAQDGKVLTELPVKSFMETPATGGSAVILEPFRDGLLCDYTRRLVSHMGYSGWGMTEFKSHPSGKDYVFMELNAKLCASVELLFLTEPDFLGHLFGVSYPPTKVERLIFADRLLDYGVGEYLRVMAKNPGARYVDLRASMLHAFDLIKEGLVRERGSGPKG